MPFSEKLQEEILVKSRRRCCICQEFAGRNVNVHHIVQEAKGGENTADNAIVLCLRCHGEVGHYNPMHPIGKKYTPDELKKHRDQHFKKCQENPLLFSNEGLEVSYKKDSASDGDIHWYWLEISYTNNSPSKQKGHMLEILFPHCIPIEKSSEIQEPIQESTKQFHFRKIIITFNDDIYRNQRVQIVDRKRFWIKYKMDHELYSNARSNEWKFICNIYVGNLPVEKYEALWSKMHVF